MTWIRFALLAIVVFAIGHGASRGVASGHGTPPSVRAAFTDGAGSIDDLVEAFVAALRLGDARAIERLRIGRDEYLDVILPGSVEPGEPLQPIDRERAGPYWWEHLSERSDLHRDDLVRIFGGRELELVDKRFAKGTKRFANHVAHRRLLLELRQADGETRHLQTGSVAEVNGRFKFISFVRD